MSADPVTPEQAIAAVEWAAKKALVQAEGIERRFDLERAVRYRYRADALALQAAADMLRGMVERQPAPAPVDPYAHADGSRECRPITLTLEQQEAAAFRAIVAAARVAREEERWEPANGVDMLEFVGRVADEHCHAIYGKSLGRGVMRDNPFPLGLKVTTSIFALKDTDERLFPASKNRSRRIHKKLIKRFGGEFRKVPAIYETPYGFIVHPALYGQLRAIAERENRDD